MKESKRLMMVHGDLLIYFRTAMWFNQSLFDDILGDTKTLVPIKVEPGLEEETKNEKSKKREKPIKEEEPSKKKKKTANDIHEQFPDDGTKPVIQVLYTEMNSV